MCNIKPTVIMTSDGEVDDESVLFEFPLYINELEEGLNEEPYGSRRIAKDAHKCVNRSDRS